MTSRTLFAVAVLITTMAIPAASQQTLTVSVTGGGKVTGTGIDCPSDCSETRLPTSIRLPGRPAPPPPTVVLTATPAFVRWGGNCAGTTGATCTVTLSSNATVSAEFYVPDFNPSGSMPRPLNVFVDGPGTVTGGGVNCAATCPGVTTAANVTLTASPAAGKAFLGWSGECSGTEPSCTVATPADVGARFGEVGAIVLRVLKQDQSGAALSQGGSVSGPGISCGMDCTGSYVGSTTLTASPGTGWRFVEWEGGCSGTATTCTVSGGTAGGTTEVIARFEATATPDTPTAAMADVQPRTSGPGRITVSPTLVVWGGDMMGVPIGTVLTFRAEPNAGASFTGWSGGCTGSEVTCTATASESEVVVNAQFSEGTVFGVGVAGSGTVRITSQVGPSSQSITLVAEPASGHVFAGWIGGCTGTTPTCTPASGAKVTAIFQPSP